MLVYCGDYEDPMDNNVIPGWTWSPMSLTHFKNVKEVIKNVTEETSKIFPNIPVGFVVGNHDKINFDVEPVPWLPFKKNMYTFLYDMWLKDSPYNHKFV